MIYISSDNDRHPVAKTFTTLHYPCRHFTSSHLNFTQLLFTTLHYPLFACLENIVRNKQLKLALCCRLLDLVSRHLDFIALSFTIRIVEALGASAATTAAFAITAAVFPQSVATTFVSIFTCLHTEGTVPTGACSVPGEKHFSGRAG